MGGGDVIPAPPRVDVGDGFWILAKFQNAPEDQVVHVPRAGLDNKQSTSVAICTVQAKSGCSCIDASATPTYSGKMFPRRGFPLKWNRSKTNEIIGIKQRDRFENNEVK